MRYPCRVDIQPSFRVRMESLKMLQRTLMNRSWSAPGNGHVTPDIWGCWFQSGDTTPNQPRVRAPNRAPLRAHGKQRSTVHSTQTCPLKAQAQCRESRYRWHRCTAAQRSRGCNDGCPLSHPHTCSITMRTTPASSHCTHDPAPSRSWCPMANATH